MRQEILTTFGLDFVSVSAILEARSGGVCGTSDCLQVLPFEGMVTGKAGELRKVFASRTTFVPAEIVPSATPRDDARLAVPSVLGPAFRQHRLLERLAPQPSSLFEAGDRVVYLGQECYGHVAVVESVQAWRRSMVRKVSPAGHGDRDLAPPQSHCSRCMPRRQVRRCCR